MKSLNHIGYRPVSLPLSADDIVEFHAARLLLLLKFCGTSNRIDGLTKLAKLDFFVRYPDFFETAKSSINTDAKSPAAVSENEVIESAMVRHHYGPWDKRYYHILAYLEAKSLIEIVKEKNSYRICLTPRGQDSARALAERATFKALVQRMKEVKSVFGRMTGTKLKNAHLQDF